MNSKYFSEISLYIVLLYGLMGFTYFDTFNSIFYLFAVNSAVTFFYYTFLIWYGQKNLLIKTNAMLAIVFFYNIVFVIIYDVLFYFDHGNIFAFGARDSIEYHYIARNMAQTTFKQAFEFMPQEWNIDDYGFPLYLSILYRTINSAMIAKFANVVLNTCTTYYIYKIGRNFLSEKYSSIAALIYGIATYSIFYQASGLKETLMIFLITGSFHYYYKFIATDQKTASLMAFIFCLSVLFFRVPLVYFIFIAVFSTELLRRKLYRASEIIKMGNHLRLPIAFILILSGYLLYEIYPLLGRYFSLVISIGTIKDTAFNHSLLFVYLNSIIAGFFGPLPTILPFAKNMNLSIISGSLILKVFLSIYFFIGLYIWKRNKAILPVLIFCLLEIIALTVVLESFEFRKGYPHMPFFILVAAYGFEHIDTIASKNMIIGKAIHLYNWMAVVLIYFWNYLRIVV